MNRCQGPRDEGDCPRAGQGAVPCAGFLVRPPNADPKQWPLWVPPDSRHCPLGWARRAADCLRQAEYHRDRWLAGLERETELVRRLAEAGDKRFTGKPAEERARICDVRWSRSAYAQELATLEQTYRQRAQAYLAFARAHPYRYPGERP